MKRIDKALWYLGTFCLYTILFLVFTLMQAVKPEESIIRTFLNVPMMWLGWLTCKVFIKMIKGYDG